jgi:hypothetical protein
MEREFTHEIIEDAVYYIVGPQQSTPPDGTFEKGTKVTVLQDGGSYAQVASEADVTAYVATGALKLIENPSAY